MDIKLIVKLLLLDLGFWWDCLRSPDFTTDSDWFTFFGSFHCVKMIASKVEFVTMGLREAAEVSWMHYATRLQKPKNRGTITFFDRSDSIGLFFPVYLWALLMLPRKPPSSLDRALKSVGIDLRWSFGELPSHKMWRGLVSSLVVCSMIQAVAVDENDIEDGVYHMLRTCI